MLWVYGILGLLSGLMIAFGRKGLNEINSTQFMYPGINQDKFIAGGLMLAGIVLAIVLTVSALSGIM